MNILHLCSKVELLIQGTLTGQIGVKHINPHSVVMDTLGKLVMFAITVTTTDSTNRWSMSGEEHYYVQ